MLQPADGQRFSREAELPQKLADNLVFTNLQPQGLTSIYPSDKSHYLRVNKERQSRHRWVFV
ncbi:hypothetical protein AGR1A_Cc50600 [Agrobacterium fabacearum CFBP 5771]|nr:hypothetical protein AGR1A_Cc50600 [Agrobacterium fabacearum CFBP 5771]